MKHRLYEAQVETSREWLHVVFAPEMEGDELVAVGAIADPFLCTDPDGPEGMRDVETKTYYFTEGPDETGEGWRAIEPAEALSIISREGLQPAILAAARPLGTDGA